MGVIQLPDELQRVIERQVAEGRAANPAAFLEEAVRRMVDESRAEEDELFHTVQSGLADAAAGRTVTVSGPDDEHQLFHGMMERLRARLSSAG